jgi:hypothetical protein
MLNTNYSLDQNYISPSYALFVIHKNPILGYMYYSIKNNNTYML